MDYEKKQKVYKTIMLIILTIVITFIITAVGVYNFMKKDGNVKYILIPGNQSAQTTLNSKIDTIRSMLQEKYIGEISDQNLQESAIKGYVEGLKDKYSEYVSAAEWQEFEEQALGNFVGVGVYLAQDKEENFVILTPIPESPAEEVGLLSGDIIQRIDDKTCKGNTLDEVSNRLRGIEGTKVKVEVKRGEQILTFTIERKTIKVAPISSKIFNETVGYLEIISFDDGTAEEFKTKYNELKQKGIKSLIIDLRDNGGGIVEEAVQIADFLLPKDKTILITKSKTQKEERTVSLYDGETDLKIVILANENSASSSEILVAALKDNERATILGNKTYGKGVMQTVYSLKDGSALKITTDEFFTPKDEKINGIGIEPNIKEDLSEKFLSNERYIEADDNQLQKAIELLK